MKRALVFLAALALGGGCADSAPDGSAPIPPPSRPNVLLVSIDTLRADHLGCYGYGRDTSPALDALAAQGLQFVYAYAPSPSTSPSHATLFADGEWDTCLQCHDFHGNHDLKRGEHEFPVSMDEAFGLEAVRSYLRDGARVYGAPIHAAKEDN